MPAAVHREAFADKIRPEKRFADGGKLAVELEKKKKMKKTHDQRALKDPADWKCSKRLQ